MKLLSVFFLLLVIPSPAQTLLPDQFPEFSTEATIDEVAVAPDGGVFIRGHFEEVDGSSRPGLAKLRANGTLDASFSPPNSEELLVPAISELSFPSLGFGVSTRPSDLLPLSNGNLIWFRQDELFLLDPDGLPISGSFDDFELNPGDGLRAHFERDGEVCLSLNRGDGPDEIVFANSSNASLIRSFTLPNDFESLPNLSIGPAAEGKIWVKASSRLGLPERFSASTTFLLENYLYRFLPSGNLDPDFPRVTLLQNRLCTLERASPTEVVLSYAREVIFLWPNTAPNSRTFEFRDAEGALVSSSIAGLNTQEAFAYALRDDKAFVLRSQSPEILCGSSFDLSTFYRGESSEFPLGLSQLTTLPDGSFLIGGTRKITPSGLLDPNHHQARATTPSSFFELVELPGDRVLVRGDFDQCDGTDHFGAAVLNADQSLNTSFKSSVDLRGTFQILRRTSGGFLALTRLNQTSPDGNTSRLVRLDPQGNLVSPIPLNFANNAIDSEGIRPPLPEDDLLSIDLLPDQRLLINVTDSRGPVPVRTSWILTNDDPETATRIRTADSQELRAVTHLGDDRIFSDNRIYRLLGDLAAHPISLPDGTQLQGLFPDGSLLLNNRRWSPVDGFSGEPLSFLTALQLSAPKFTPTRRGKIFVSSASVLLPRSLSFLSLPPSPVLRLHSSLQVDPTFKLTLDREGRVTDLLSVGDDTWVAGQFSEINGVARSGLARITDDQTAGFQEWMRLTTGISSDTQASFDPTADSDGDGLSDYYEYALGSHPSEPAASDPRLQKLSTMTYQLPCNPEAPEVVRRLEVSSDLQTWRPALASEIQLETTRSCLTWTLRPGFVNLFSRITISE